MTTVRVEGTIKFDWPPHILVMEPGVDRAAEEQQWLDEQRGDPLGDQSVPIPRPCPDGTPVW